MASSNPVFEWLRSGQSIRLHSPEVPARALARPWFLERLRDHYAARRGYPCSPHLHLFETHAGEREPGRVEWELTPAGLFTQASYNEALFLLSQLAAELWRASIHAADFPEGGRLAPTGEFGILAWSCPVERVVEARRVLADFLSVHLDRLSRELP